MDNFRRRMDAVSAAASFHKKFLEKVKNFVKEKTSTSDANDEDYLNGNNHIKIKAEIHKLHKIQHLCIDNLKTLLNLEAGRLDIAKELNDGVLLCMPDNVNALWSRILLWATTDNAAGENADQEAENISNRLEKDITTDAKLMLIAKAEVAGMYTYLEIDLESLRISISLYEEVLDQIGTVLCDAPSDSLLESLIVFWKQDLVQNYALLTHGHKHDTALSRAKVLVRDLGQSPIVENKLKAKAWANLAVIFEHHKPTYQSRWLGEMKDAEKQLMRKCFAKAMQLDPSNGRIYMQAARELRKRVKTEPDLLQAIEWFKISLMGEDVEDIRGFTLFHMGLTYRSLWIIKDDPLHKVAVNADLFNSDKHSNHPHYEGRVIKPQTQPLDFCLVPPPYKTPNNSVDWRFLNLIARDPNNEYLLEARRCLKEASETKEERCLFLIELTRTYISTGDVAEARKCLQEAQKDPCSDMVNEDFVGVSLHENMAFLEESEMMRTIFNDAKAEKVKSLYRESIRQSTQSGWQPVVAFHCLLAVLYKQLETCARGLLPERDQMILQDEYFLLYMAIQEAKESRKIVKSFATDDFKVALMWRLIEMFYRRNQQYDAAAAFTYLSILTVANKLTTEVNGINLTYTEKRRILLQSAERVTLQRANEPRFFPHAYQVLYNLYDYNQQPESAFDIEPLSNNEKKKLSIVMKIIQPELPTNFACRKERV